MALGAAAGGNCAAGVMVRRTSAFVTKAALLDYGIEATTDVARIRQFVSGHAP